MATIACWLLTLKKKNVSKCLETEDQAKLTGNGLNKPRVGPVWPYIMILLCNGEKEPGLLP